MSEALESHFEAQRTRHLRELEEFLRIPSVSALPDHRRDVLAAADFVAAQLRTAGVPDVRVLETARNPVVFGAWLGAPKSPTILVYGHYDVQPPDPLDRWQTPPFEPTLRDGRLYARGVSDDKAPMFIAIKAAEALLAVAEELPLNVKFLFEGEEEIGSPSLRPFVEEHAELLAADLVVSADGAMWRPSEPSLTTSGKGLCALQIDVETAATDLHSGRHGGGVANALHAVAELVAGLHDAQGRVAVEGFYDTVRPLGPEERLRIAAIDFDEASYRRDLGLGEPVGEPGYSTLERQWTRPTLDCNGIWGGFQGEGTKTVIPCEAHAKISCRLVPDQRPADIAALVERHLLRRAPRGARVRVQTFPGLALPYAMPSDHPALRTAAGVLEETMGGRPLFVRMGGTLPCAEIFQQALGAYTLFFSFSTADEQFHAPNEFFRLERLDQGFRAWARLFQQLGAQPQIG